MTSPAQRSAGLDQQATRTPRTTDHPPIPPDTPSSEGQDVNDRNEMTAGDLAVAAKQAAPGSIEVGGFIVTYVEDLPYLDELKAAL